jgi:GDP-mannose 6-dehydrogenase
METASLVKYASNAFRATKIAFANEIATISELEGADPLTVMDVFPTDTLLPNDTSLNVSSAYLRRGFESVLSREARRLDRIWSEDCRYQMSHPVPVQSA